MKRKLMLLMTFLFIGIGLVTAQVSKVTGVVTSEEDGLPVVGASVLVKGTTVGTVTDMDGKFTLTNVPSSAKTLVISFIGMKSQELHIKPEVNVVLHSDSEQLDEVMVVAYGTAKKSSFTGSAAVVKTEQIEKIQSSDVTKALAGAVSGVQITTASGAPGSGTSIRVRGLGSINASSEPLIVVDGAPFDGDLNMINTQDVESMAVLKDAAANALYGARGANGVVLITTKKGKSGKATITVDAKWGSNSRGVPEYDVMRNPATYYATYWRELKGLYEANGLENPGQLASNNLISDSGSGLAYNITSVANNEVVLPDGTFNPNAKIKYMDNWEKELFNSGLRQEYNANMTGGNEKTSYYMSFGYLNDEGYIVKSGFERFSTRLRLEHQFSKNIKIGGNFSYVNTTTVATSATEEQDQTAGTNMFYVSRVMAPIYPIYKRDENGNFMYDERGRIIYDYGDTPGMQRPMLGNSNALGSQSLDDREYNRDYFTGNMFADVKFLNDFKFTFRAGVENDNVRTLIFQNGEYGQFTSQNGISTRASERNMTVNLQQLLTWEHVFGKHSINALIGHETYQTTQDYLSGSKNNFALWGSTSLNQAVSNPQASSLITKYATEGFLGRVEYNYEDKYYVSGSYRRDASSVFHPDHRWGNFWSVGASWRLKQEDFLQDVEWLDNLKYKISYGSQGNDFLLLNGQRNRYAYMDQYKVINNNGQPAITQVYKGNDNLKWETNYNFNTGFEFSMFNGRLNGGLEFFSRYAKDLLFNRPLPASSGNISYPDNIGDMRNTGFEIELSGDLVRTDKVTWSLGFNATTYKNKILTLPEEKRESGIWNGIFKMVEGGSYYDYYIKEYAGVDSEDGSAMWYKDVLDEQGNVTGKETTKDYSLATDYKAGSALPDVYGGINTSLNAFGFDFSVVFSYQLGGKGYDYTYAGLMNSAQSAGYNFHNDILNAWTPENTNTDIPKLNAKATTNNSVSTRFLTSASYLSLQNISLGYTLPNKWLNRLGCQSVRLYIVADNLWLLSARKGYDPRTNWNGESNYNYSALRTVSGGLTIKF